MNRWITTEQLAAFEAEGTNAHRLFTSLHAWVERFGADVLVSYKTELACQQVSEGVKEWAERTGFSLGRLFTRFLPKQNAERVSPALAAGDPALDLQTVVTERGVRYGIDFGAGYSAGLFMDQRANRSFLRALAPKHVLNTFAYTCSFSLVAALAGARTVSVDLSKKSLERGRANFGLNGLALDGHRFIADDVIDVLPRFERRGEKFDAIILDPPTFSRGARGRKWQVEEQIETLLGAAVELALPGAVILISTNCTRLDLRTLERTARFVLKTAHRGGDFHHEAPLPDFPEGEGARTLWLHIK
jgi:23S rRNA (cytosine1962-C5)-methyltransferase